MIDLAKVVYRVVVVANDGTQYDATDICSALGWSEGEKELAAKITCKLACVEVNGALVTDVVTLNTPIIVYASDGGGFQEMIRQCHQARLDRIERRIHLGYRGGGRGASEGENV